MKRATLAGRPFAFLSPEPRESRTPRRAPARIALQTSAVPHQREIQALRAHLALIALGLGLGAAFGGGEFGVDAGFGEVLELLGRRDFLLGLGFERGRAGDFAARAHGGQRGDFAAATHAPTSAGFAGRASPCRGG